MQGDRAEILYDKWSSVINDKLNFLVCMFIKEKKISGKPKEINSTVVIGEIFRNVKFRHKFTILEIKNSQHVLTVF